jgi:hypothetical protein
MSSIPRRECVLLSAICTLLRSLALLLGIMLCRDGRGLRLTPSFVWALLLLLLVGCALIG